jgi:hypothetical protein
VDTGKHVPNYEIEVGTKKFPGDLIVLPFKDYNLILGMDWLLRNHA